MFCSTFSLETTFPQLIFFESMINYTIHSFIDDTFAIQTAPSYHSDSNRVLSDLTKNWQMFPSRDGAVSQEISRK